ncbi:MAG: DNA topoisomerase IV subunit A [Alphaproteobacteria bacterium]|nr:DNA topoisomerase IV subunit A [Alphaproteobacteria bacterium]
MSGPADNDDLLNNDGGDIRDVNFGAALSERYLAYALSTIMSRSLPDVRDGLKPVQRRVLYAMRQLKVDPSASPRKCATIVGEVIGKYHPHGDTAIYDALVRLAQDFVQRYPLINGQGNFGNIDGDNAAAYRYTEAKLTEISAMLLRNIDEDAVDFRDTYNGEEKEPVVLPAAFPNLLANGTQGIAVGMATAVPPHNVGELLGALRHLIDNPKATVEDLMTFVPGPDFPTGGLLVEDADTLQEVYETGRGSMRLRARWEVEKLKAGTWQIAVTEIPYQVAKGRLLEKAGELVSTKKLHLCADIRDESTADVRIVIEPKSRNVEPAHLMESLFRNTDLEVRVPMNLNVLNADTVPGVLNLREALGAFLDHRHEVLIRRLRYRLGEIDTHLERVEGLMVVFLNLDEVIRIIREEDDPRAELIRTFDLTEAQGEYILNTRLRSLRKLEEMKLREEREALLKERSEIEDLLDNRRAQWKTVRREFDELEALLTKKAPDWMARRTTIAGAAPVVDMPDEALVEREAITVALSRMGWLRALRGHGHVADEIKYRDGDKGRFVVPAYTTDKLIVLTDQGRCHTVGADKLPSGRGFGEPLSLTVELAAGAKVIALFPARKDGKRLLAASDGRGFICPEPEMISNQKAGKQALNPGKGAAATLAYDVEPAHDAVAVVGTNRRMLVFPLSELPEMSKGRGVKLQHYSKGDMADAKTFSMEEGLTWAWGQGKTRTFTDYDEVSGARASAGRAAPSGFTKNGLFGG